MRKSYDLSAADLRKLFRTSVEMARDEYSERAIFGEYSVRLIKGKSYMVTPFTVGGVQKEHVFELFPNEHGSRELIS